MQKAFFWLCFMFASAGVAQADIFTCRHPDGSTEITDAPCARGATTVNVLKSAKPQANLVLSNSAGGALSTKQVQNAVSSASNGNGNTGNGTKVALAARVEPNVQKNRDDIRRRVLSSELELEEKSLTDARSQFNGGNLTPQSDESLNSPKYLDRRARMQQSLNLHEKNVAAIRQELANLK